MLSLVNLPELPHPGNMPLVVRVLLGWFTVSAVVSPFIGAMLASPSPRALPAVPSGSAPRAARTPSLTAS
jgi:hypothetical protein